MNLEIHYDSEDTGGSGEWAALYVDGKLDTVGDSYNTEERAFKLAGVRAVHDSAFMRGQNQRSGVAPTLDAVKAYVEERDARLTRAANLRRQAAELEAEAARLSAPLVIPR